MHHSFIHYGNTNSCICAFFINRDAVSQQGHSGRTDGNTLGNLKMSTLDVYCLRTANELSGIDEELSGG